MRKRIIALLLIFVTLISVMIVPVSATPGDAVDYLVDNFWNMIRGKDSDVGVSQAFPFLDALLSPGKTPETATESDWKNAYNQYNTTINNNYGSSTFGSDGLLYWSPKFKEAKLNTSGKISIGLNASAPSIPDFQKWKLTFTPSSSFVGCLSGIYNGSGGAASFLNVRTYFEDVFPITGTYTRQPGTVFSGSYTVTAGSRHPILYSEGVGSSSYYAQGAKYENLFIETVVSSPSSNSEYITTFSINLSPCVYSILPASGLIDITTGDIGTDSRTGSLSGNFGYYGDNGQLIAAENMTIVNETNNTYTNPQTGATSPVTNWTYDYSDRSYHLTLESGDTVNVTYGDENVTIKEGDTVYNIYYITQGGGTGPGPSPTPGPGGCAHKYTSTVTTAPACLTAGVKTFTCSLCSDTYTEKTPATGHTWVLDRTVNSEYDTDGKVTVQGYSIYKCSVCGNEYKDTEGTGPPDSGGESGGGFLDWLLGKIGELLGSIGNGVLTLLKTALGKIFDGVIGIIDMITEKLSQILDALFKIFDNVPKMFDGFTLFLTNCFAFLPPEIITFLTFGVLAMVLIAIFRFFLGK